MTSNEETLDKLREQYNLTIEQGKNCKTMRDAAELIKALDKVVYGFNELVESMRTDEKVEQVAEAMFNWMVEPWQNLNYKDESIRTAKYRELAKIAVSTIFK